MSNAKPQLSVAPTSDKKPRQGRSPAYPFISLKAALERAEAFRVAEGGRPRHYSPLTAAAKAWGIGAKTGDLKQTVAALGHYGLFEFQGAAENRSARLTDFALRILLDKQPVSPNAINWFARLRWRRRFTPSCGRSGRMRFLRTRR